MHYQVQAHTIHIYNTIITTLHNLLRKIAQTLAMNPIEIFVSALAPHPCIVCGAEGSPICRSCATLYFKRQPSCCYRCGINTQNFLPCFSCKLKTQLDGVWIANEYMGLTKEAVGLLKFQRVKAIAKVIADWLNQFAPQTPQDIIVSPVPTANNRVRIRGYDQACLIARRFARQRRLTYKPTLLRATHTRQVGANRSERFKQLDNAFRVKKVKYIKGRHIILIDDVVTTGATLESAAKILKANGVRMVKAIVFARQAEAKTSYSSSTRNGELLGPVGLRTRPIKYHRDAFV